MLRTVVLAVLAASAGAQVIGIDFGSDFIKIAGVKPSVGVDIVLNEQSKRKSNNYIGYRGDDRFLGEDAANLAPRFPDQMYTFLNRLIGKPFDDKFKDEIFRDGFGLPYNLVKDEKRGTINIHHPDPDQVFTMEELMGQLFGYVTNTAAKHLEQDVQGAVFTIPSFLSHTERQALVDAANVTGLPSLGFLHGTLAAALQYGIGRRGFGNATQHVVIYDMGSSRTEVGVYRFTPPLEVDGKVPKGGELGNLETLAVVSDESLGGRTISARIANHLAKKFEAKTGEKLLGNTDRAARKAMTSLLKVSNKAKEVLSANKVAPVAVEELFAGKPFFYDLPRAEYEEVCEDIFQRGTPVLTKALAKAGIDKSQVDALEIIGGGVRIPRFQQALSDSMDGRALDKTLNGDECMAQGAAFYAAKLSGAFRTKGFIINDTPPYNVTFKLSQLEGSDKTPKMRPLFMNSNLGSKKTITVAREQDFSIELFASTVDEEGAEKTELIRTYKIDGVSEALENMGFNKDGKNESNKHAVTAQIRLTQEGLVELESVTVKYDEHVTKEKKIKIKEAKVEKKADEEAKEEKKDEEAPEGEEKKEEATEEKAEEKAAEEGEKKEGGDETPAPEAPKYKFVNKTEVKKHRKTVVFAVEDVFPLNMDTEDFEKSKKLLKDLAKVEETKREVAAAKNALESYIYWTKFEGVLDKEDVQEFIDDETREKLTAKLEEVSEWCEYGDGSEEGTPKDQYVDKKREIQDIVETIFGKKREKEAEERRAAEQKRKEEREAKDKDEAADKAEDATAEDETAEGEAASEEPKEE